mmetsp:Transcript_55490/g.63394  ORF Transcript_55490/g.63394 Transcript_55490/m.63394 type:complete len:160 (-) Transcript_55490:179-658(-)
MEIDSTVKEEEQPKEEEPIEDEFERFQIELEFVQALANPHYLHFLAQHRHLDQPAMINYLKYMLYWTKPEYAQYVDYPDCLFFLKLLQSPKFRKELAIREFVEFLYRQQFYNWTKGHRLSEIKKELEKQTEETAVAEGVMVDSQNTSSQSKEVVKSQPN